MQTPSVSGHDSNVPPREAEDGGEKHGVPQPPDPMPGCPLQPPIPTSWQVCPAWADGTIPLRREEQPSPSPGSSISGPFMAIGSSRAAARVASQPVCSLPGRGKGQWWGHPGMPRKRLTLRSPEHWMLPWNSNIWGTLHPAHCQVYFMPAAMHWDGWMDGGILPNIRQGCCELHWIPKGGTVA